MTKTPDAETNENAVSREEHPMPTITRIVSLAKCLRCGFEWQPRVERPSKCARCQSNLWDVPRAVQLPGKPAPERKGKPRGIGFKAGQDERRQPRRKNEKSAEDSTSDATPQTNE